MIYNHPIGSIYHLYTTYILPTGWLYITYHLLREPETTIDFMLAILRCNWSIDPLPCYFFLALRLQLGVALQGHLGTESWCSPLSRRCTRNFSGRFFWRKLWWGNKDSKGFFRWCHGYMSFQMFFWFNGGKVCQKLWSNDLKIGFWNRFTNFTVKKLPKESRPFCSSTRVTRIVGS